MRKTANRMADAAAGVGYENGWNDARLRIAELEAALDDLWLQAVEGPTNAWVMIPTTEWRQVFERVNLGQSHTKPDAR